MAFQESGAVFSSMALAGTCSLWRLHGNIFALNNKTGESNEFSHGLHVPFLRHLFQMERSIVVLMMGMLYALSGTQLLEVLNAK
jgi:hypothetical protein